MSVDSAPIPAGVLGLPRAVDPGHHVVEVKTASGAAKQEIDVKEGDQTPVELTLIATVAVPEVDNSQQEAEPETSTPETKSHSPTLLTWTGVGLAGVGIIAGTVTGVLSMSKKSTLQSEVHERHLRAVVVLGLQRSQLARDGVDDRVHRGGRGGILAAATLVVGHRESTPVPAAAPPAATGLTIRPSIGLGSAGVTGTF